MSVPQRTLGGSVVVAAHDESTISRRKPLAE